MANVETSSAMTRSVVTFILFAATSAFADHGVKRGSGGNCKGAQDPARCEERQAKIDARGTGKESQRQSFEDLPDLDQPVRD